MDYKKDIIIYDEETIKGCFLASFYIIETEEYKDFLINEHQNDLIDMCKWVMDRKDKWFVGYNNLNFDAQVLHFILEHHEKWYDLSGIEIAAKISAYGSEVIDRQNYGVSLDYREESFTIKQIDLPRIWHFFNENKRVSLKQLEFELRAPHIQNFEVNVDKVEFSEKDVEDLIFYCHNDVENTYTHWLYTIGEVEHPLYKGKDKLADRLIIQKEVGLPCINWDDVKIGADWNKKDYLEMTKRDEKDLRPKKINHYYGRKFGDFFPPTVRFQTKGLQEFMKFLGCTYILNEKQEFRHTFPGTNLTATIAKGGVHSNEKPRFIKSNEDEIYIQNDIGSQYPNAMRKYGVFPKHLGKEWNEMLTSKIERRLKYKQLYKDTKDAKYNSLQEMGKLSLNGGAYGRLNTRGDWQEDPCEAMKVTIGCQLEIMMIVEHLVMEKFKVVSLNTDGWDCVIPKKRLTEYLEIVKMYEKMIGNEELGNVEYTVFDWIAQTSVNDYIAKKSGELVNGVLKPHYSKYEGDEYKLKGDFSTDIELHKNSSFKVIPLALNAWFTKGIPVEEFVNLHNDIFDFCARSNSGMTYIHEGYEDGKTTILPKLLRYYVSKKGIHIKKMVKPNVDTKARDVNVAPAEFTKTVCNKLLEDSHKEHLENVDREWYIGKVNEILLKIDRNKTKITTQKIDKNQLSLF